MSDQGWATLVGLAVVVVMRLVDFYLPRGYVARWVDRWARRNDEGEK